jgi:hypothetical protein
MSKTSQMDKVKSDQVKDSLHDDDLDAVTGGAG